jgi:hypothetical protein
MMNYCWLLPPKEKNMKMRFLKFVGQSQTKICWKGKGKRAEEGH